MKVGVIGGTGFQTLDELKNAREIAVETPFGSPSEAVVQGTMGGCDVCFLARHGRGHRLMPAEINHRANIYALKTLGVERVLSISAVGSLREGLRPGDVCLPDQYFDRTKRSFEHTFFGDGAVVHVAFGEPTCREWRERVAGAAGRALAGLAGSDSRLTVGGTYVCMEGPAFSTKAESGVYRKLGFDVIGMTSLPEAKLCREAELCYQSVSMVTDYDCWHETEAQVTVERITGRLDENRRVAEAIVLELIREAPAPQSCECGKALAAGFASDPAVMPASTRRKLSLFLDKYLGA